MTDESPILEVGALDRLLDMTGGDPEFVRELVETFLVDAVTQLDAMDGAAADGSPEAMLRPAHSLKSNAASVGATRLSEISRSLEADARSGAVDNAVARAAIARASFEDVRVALAEALETL